MSTFTVSTEPCKSRVKRVARKVKKGLRDVTRLIPGCGSTTGLKHRPARLQGPLAPVLRNVSRTFSMGTTFTSGRHTSKSKSGSHKRWFSFSSSSSGSSSREDSLPRASSSTETSFSSGEQPVPSLRAAAKTIDSGYAGEGVGVRGYEACAETIDSGYEGDAATGVSPSFVESCATEVPALTEAAKYAALSRAQGRIDPVRVPLPSFDEESIEVQPPASKEPETLVCAVEASDVPLPPITDDEAELLLHPFDPPKIPFPSVDDEGTFGAPDILAADVAEASISLLPSFAPISPVSAAALSLPLVTDEAELRVPPFNTAEICLPPDDDEDLVSEVADTTETTFADAAEAEMPVAISTSSQCPPTLSLLCTDSPTLGMSAAAHLLFPPVSRVHLSFHLTWWYRPPCATIF